MTPEEMIKSLKSVVDDIGAVMADLQDVIDGELTMPDVNITYAQDAVARTHRVVVAIKLQS